MKQIHFLGDIHGNLVPLIEARRKLDGPIIQIGDFGVGFGENDWEEKVDTFNTGYNIRFIRGNHDSPDLCRGMKSWIEDGTVENGIMFVGGAWSIDYQWRTPGRSWWPDEELSDAAFEHILSRYALEKPRVMVTHDAPHSALVNMFEQVHLHKPIQRTRTSHWLDEMFAVHQPEYWVFGHWHMHRRETINGTNFICANIDQIVTLDLK